MSEKYTSSIVFPPCLSQLYALTFPPPMEAALSPPFPELDNAPLRMRKRPRIGNRCLSLPYVYSKTPEFSYTNCLTSQTELSASPSPAGQWWNSHMGRSFVYPMSASPSLLDFLDFLTVSLTVCITNHSKTLFIGSCCLWVVWVIFLFNCWLGWSWMILTASLTWLWAQLSWLGWQSRLGWLRFLFL